MISKELLSEVFKMSVYYCDLSPNERDINIIFNESEISRTGSINVYELAHKCKELAFNIDTAMINSYVTEALMGIASIRDDNGTILFCEVCDTEPEAIFKACQFILDNKDKQ